MYPYRVPQSASEAAIAVIIYQKGTRERETPEKQQAFGAEVTTRQSRESDEERVRCELAKEVRSLFNTREHNIERYACKYFIPIFLLYITQDVRRFYLLVLVCGAKRACEAA